MKDIKKGILNELVKYDDGLTIQNLIDHTGFSRGSIKMNLLYLMVDKKVREIEYGSNTKVYKIKES